jgi:molybdopterin adenylyltransferase
MWAEGTLEEQMYRLAILTVSTLGALGQREDTGSRAIQEVLAPPEYEVVRYEIVSDEVEAIAQRLAQWADSPDVDLVVSTGGTGLGRRDVTPEACRSILDKEVPGLAEAMRAETLKFTPMAMLSRSVAGIRGNTLIITLPGSPRGVKECLDVVKPVLPHAIELLQQDSVNQHPR